MSFRIQCLLERAAYLGLVSFPSANAAALLVLLLASAGVARAQPSYTCTILPAPAGDTAPYSYYANGINDSGTVAGGDNSSNSAVVWASSTPTVLGSGVAYAVNNPGMITGQANIP